MAGSVKVVPVTVMGIYSRGRSTDRALRQGRVHGQWESSKVYGPHLNTHNRRLPWMVVVARQVYVTVVLGDSDDLSPWQAPVHNNNHHHHHHPLS